MNDNKTNDEQNLNETTEKSMSFIADISTQDDTQKVLQKWVIQVTQEDGKWSDTITYEEPDKVLEVPILSPCKVQVSAENGTTYPASMQEIACCDGLDAETVSTKGRYIVSIFANNKELIGGINAEYKVTKDNSIGDTC